MLLHRITCICMVAYLLVLHPFTLAQKSEPVIIKVTDPAKFSSDFHEFILERTFLPLETSPDCLMPGHSGGVFFYKDLIIIHYAAKGGVYIFSENGKFKKFINPLGRGPNECISIYSVDVFNDEIFLFDQRGGKIMVVDMEGNPKRIIKTPLYPYDLIHNDKGQILMYQQKELFEGKPYDIVGFDESKGNFFGYMPADHLKKSLFQLTEAFFKTANGPVMAVTACDTVYAVNGYESNPLYILDYGKRGFKGDSRGFKGNSRGGLLYLLYLKKYSFPGRLWNNQYYISVRCSRCLPGSLLPAKGRS